MTFLGQFQLDHFGPYTATQAVASKTGIHGADTSSNVVQVLIPQDLAVEGNIFIIQDEGGNAGTNNIQITPLGGYNINGSGSVYIASNYSGRIVYFNGTNYYAY